MDKPHEGEMLMALLRQHRRTQADLANALGIQPSAVTKYVKAQTLGDRAWLSVKEGLARLNIPSTSIRDEPVVMARERNPMFGRDLRPLVSEWSRDHLRSLRDILNASPEDRRSLVYWIDAKLER